MKLLPSNVGILSCNFRKEILQETLEEVRLKTSFSPRVFNVPEEKGKCHKGANERALFQWAAARLKDDDWLLRLEDDLKISTSAEKVINQLVEIEGVPIFSLGDIQTRYSNQIFYENLIFRTLVQPVFGIQALLVRGDYVKKIASVSVLDKPSEQKILSVLENNQKVWHLIEPNLFSHRSEIKSVCWPERKELKTIIKDMNTNLIIPLKNKITVSLFCENGLQDVEKGEIIVTKILDYPKESRILLEVEGMAPIVFSGDEYPKKASFKTLTKLVQARFNVAKN